MDHIKHLRAMGYTEAEHLMSGHVERWWSWYTASNDWYSSVERSSDGRTTYKVDRLTIRPAKLVCQEWASLIMNERVEVSAEDDAASEWLKAWALASRFTATGQRLVERAFALGTGAWVLSPRRVKQSRTGRTVADAAADIAVKRFDARQIVPLSYDDDECADCAFVSEVVVSGKRYGQIQIHELDGGTYHIRTRCFDEKGRMVVLPGVLEDIDTETDVPTFALVRPGIENQYLDYAPVGVSIFDDAIGAVKLTDTAIDNMWRDVWLGQKMVFLSERMLDHDEYGNVTVPRAQDQQLFRLAETDTGEKMVEEYNPDLRASDNKLVVGTGLALLGSRCGLGNDYFSLEATSGVAAAKTATEVISEDSDLFRNVRKHSNAIVPAVQRIAAGALALARTIQGADVPDDPGAITVTLDDSVIEDRAAKKKADLADVASGIMPPWEYRAKWYGEEEAAAKRMVAEAQGLLAPEL